MLLDKTSHMKIHHLLVLCASIMIACGGKNTDSNVKAPGVEKSTESKVLEKGADLLQDKSPLKMFNTYLDGFHFYNGNMAAQMEAHHYVSQINEDTYQAIILDSNNDHAKVMGVEYIISARIFKTLDNEEKKLWHSHQHEVKSGTLIAPGLPEAAEHKLMEKLVSTYGKTIHTWHTDRHLELPLGAPMLMMGFTRDGQINGEMVSERDNRFNVSTSEKRKNREDIPIPVVDPMANAWQKNIVKQFIISDYSKNKDDHH
jgi:hypothetical protein